MLGSYIQQLRMDAKLSRSLLARRSGISRITLWRWEQGETFPRRVELQMALEALQATSQQQSQAFALYNSKSPTVEERIRVQEGATLLHRGDLLIALRHRYGMTQEQAAYLAGIPRSTLSRWENMQTWPSRERLESLCRIYRANKQEQDALFSWQSRLTDDSTLGISAIQDRIVSWSKAIYEIDELECLMTLGRLDRIVHANEHSNKHYNKHTNKHTNENEEVQPLFCLALLYYANHLMNRYRLVEAARYLCLAEPMLSNAGLETQTFYLRLEAYSMRLRYRQDKRLNRRFCGEISSAKLQPLVDRIDALPASFRSVILGDYAISLGMRQLHSEADRANIRALGLSQCLDRPEQLQRMVERQWLLTEAGRHSEVIALTLRPTGIPFMDAYFIAMRGKALLGAGCRQEAQDHLQEAYRLGKHHDWPAVYRIAEDTLSFL